MRFIYSQLLKRDVARQINDKYVYINSNKSFDRIFKKLE